MRVVVISDTHCEHGNISVPDGDVLVHCGDFTFGGRRHEVENFAAWMAFLPHKTKLVIAGNHEIDFDGAEGEARALRWIGGRFTYLRDTSFEIDGVKFYGTPWQPAFNDWAFGLPTEDALSEKWAMIPADTEVLITHCPPREILDWVPARGRGSEPQPQGSSALRWWVDTNKPAVHLFGHIHEAYGAMKGAGGTLFVNAALLNAAYRPVRKPVVLDRHGPGDWYVVEWGPT